MVDDFSKRNSPFLWDSGKNATYMMQDQNRSTSMLNVGRIIFSNFEKNILRELVDEHREILECKKNDWRSIKRKTETWNAIAEEFNSHSGVNHKDCKQLKKCWENMKARAKKALNKDIIEIPRFVEELEAQGADNASIIGVSPGGGVGITSATIAASGSTNSGGSIKVEPLHNRLYVEADHPYDGGGGHSHDGTIGGGGPGGGGSTPGGTVVVGSAGGTPGTPGGGATIVSIIGPGGGGGGGHFTNNISNHNQLHNHNPQQHLQNTFGHQTVTVLECPDDDCSPPPSISVPVSGGPAPGIFSMANGEMCSPNSMLGGETPSQVVLVKMQQEQHEIHMLMMKRKLDYAAAEHKAKMDVLQIQRQYWALQCEELVQKKYPSPSHS